MWIGGVMLLVFMAWLIGYLTHPVRQSRQPGNGDRR
jgi:hypothetical protein